MKAVLTIFYTVFTIAIVSNITVESPKMLYANEDELIDNVEEDVKDLKNENNNDLPDDNNLENENNSDLPDDDNLEKSMSEDNAVYNGITIAAHLRDKKPSLNSYVDAIKKYGLPDTKEYTPFTNLDEIDFAIKDDSEVNMNAAGVYTSVITLTNQSFDTKDVEVDVIVGFASPVISAHNISISVGKKLSNQDIINLSNATATDAKGQDITSRIVISNLEDLDTSKVQKYDLELSVSDDQGNEVFITIEVDVNSNTLLPETGTKQILLILFAGLSLVLICTKKILKV